MFDTQTFGFLHNFSNAYVTASEHDIRFQISMAVVGIGRSNLSIF